MKIQGLLLCLFFCAPSLLFAQSIDETNSKITFEVSNFGVRTVSGTISGMKGTIGFNQNDLSASYFDVSLEVATIDTDNNARDKHLKNEDFFEVNTYPKMYFKSSSIYQDGNQYKVKGQLTIKDVTKEVEIPFSSSISEGKTTLEGQLTINRKDYHVGMDTGKFSVGLDIEVTITCVLN